MVDPPNMASIGTHGILGEAGAEMTADPDGRRCGRLPESEKVQCSKATASGKGVLSTGCWLCLA